MRDKFDVMDVNLKQRDRIDELLKEVHDLKVDLAGKEAVIYVLKSDIKYYKSANSPPIRKPKEEPKYDYGVQLRKYWSKEDKPMTGMIPVEEIEALLKTKTGTHGGGKPFEYYVNIDPHELKAVVDKYKAKQPNTKLINGVECVDDWVTLADLMYVDVAAKDRGGRW